MSAHLGLSPRWVRYAAAGAAAVTALLYVLSGTAGPIKLVFSLAMGGVFALVALALFFFADRMVWMLAAVLDLGAIIGYFAVAPSREPHFELWGIVIKAAQVVLLAALGYLLMRHRGGVRVRTQSPQSPAPGTR